MSQILFYFTKSAREIFVDIARSMYQGNQNKIQSQIPNNANSKRSNWKKERERETKLPP
jgi:hypothetical protein